METKLLKNKSLIIGLIVLLMFAAWFAFLYRPTHGRIVDLKQQLAELKQKEKEAIPQSDITRIEKYLDSLSVHIDAERLRFYPEADLLELGKSVEEIGKQYNLDLLSIIPDYNSLSELGGESGELSELNVDIVFQGMFSDFTRFLDNIETFPFAMRVQEAALEKETIETRELTITLQGVIVLRKARETDDKKNLMNA